MSAVQDNTATEAATAEAIRVAGEPYEALPEDLYIPPDALRVFLEAFEGPLDLLLYLIRRQNLDILDIPVFTITQQYMAYIELMEEMAIELAGEYLLMAAMLAEIKSRMLLPKTEAAEEDEGEDPRAELIRRLAEYEQFKEAAENLDDCPRVGRDITPVRHEPVEMTIERPAPEPDLRALLGALHDVLTRAELYSQHVIEREPLSVREHMTRILERLDSDRPVAFVALVALEEGRLGVVVSFLAILELARESLIAIEQDAPYAQVSLRRRGVE
ncbi:segregation and condensation protein A [Salinisphaera hydrothermalis]|uniref:Segregation and condensation protein A n=1 Tax=Salinisphaera hydrothermalis (strain C41B8) TaxID=1304275 RepID=A0A084IG45_SALHC|nr:segregation/condensation protein A [Salinisphaera hydrothermalis]KEZ75679.1 segregation and condensation protein [Salinisphaera hydrothermalis C41B8]